jgi:hypothetical protein
MELGWKDYLGKALTVRISKMISYYTGIQWELITLPYQIYISINGGIIYTLYPRRYRVNILTKRLH